MAALQRRDALRALGEMDVRRSMPLRAPLRTLLAAGGCGLVLLALLFAPNPQDQTLQKQAQFRQRMEKPAQSIEKAAQELDEAVLGEKETKKLRRLLGDLAR